MTNNISDTEDVADKAAFLGSNDYQSIWQAAHRWHSFDPDNTDPANLPVEVRKTIFRIIRGYLQKQLILRKNNGYRIPYEDIFLLFFYNINRKRMRLSSCILKGEFDKPFLNSIFIERSNVLTWCNNHHIAPPPFWIEQRPSAPGDSTNIANKFVLDNRIRDDRLDKLVCQAIARTLWQIDPNIHPSHMAKSKFIQRYGNGKLYTDENTVKNWIVEVDPMKSERKTGRPPKTDYLIDLQTGDLRR